MRADRLLRASLAERVAALEVSVAELLGSEPNTMKAKPGPQSQLQRKFDRVKLLPREK
jgi:hypothetical protein